MTKDQANKILLTLLTDSPRNQAIDYNSFKKVSVTKKEQLKYYTNAFVIYQACESLTTLAVDEFKQTDNVYLRGFINDEAIQFSIDKTSASDYFIEIITSDLNGESDLNSDIWVKSAYKAFDFVEAVKLINFKLNSELSISIYCKEEFNAINYIQKVFGKGTEVYGNLVINHEFGTIIVNKEQNTFTVICSKDSQTSALTKRNIDTYILN